MLKLTLRSFFDRKIRLALTTFAVVLGVAFVSGSFVLADSLRAVFDDIAEEVGAPISVRVRGISAIESNDLTRPPSPDSLADELAGVDGVASVTGIVEGFPFVSTADGELVRSQGPTLAYNYEADAVSAIEIVRGDAPGTGEVLFDEFAADRYDIAIGDVVNVRTLAEPEDFAVSGIASFGEEDFGAVFVLFDTPTAQRLFGLPDSFSYINVSAAGALSPDELAERVNATLPADFEAVTGEIVSDEFSAFFDVIITVFQSALLAFAAVALVVSAFIINNTFSIVLGQRIKELGLLRCLGASGRQVRTSVLLEALLIGGVASVAGLFGGLGVAALINQIISAAGDGGGLPSGGIILAPRTWIVAIVVGIGVTLLASLSPARRAASIPPIAALTDDFVLSATRTRRRVLVGLAFAVVGGLAVILGVLGAGDTTTRLLALGAGALLLFIAVALLSPQVAAPIARAVGAPIAWIGRISGTLARNNAARNPHRTSATAAALMVGLALVTMVLVVGTSFKKTVTSLLETSITADYYVAPAQQQGPGVFSRQLAVELNELPEVDLAISFRGGPGTGARALIGGAGRDIAGVPSAAFGSVVHAGIVDGGYDGLENDGVLVHADPATDLGLSPGDTLTAVFPDTTRTLTVVGVYDDASIVGNWAVDLSTYEEVFGSSMQDDVFVAASVAPGIDPASVRPAIETVTDRYPEVTLRDSDEFAQNAEDQLNQLLLTVNALLLFAVVIAALGVVNTLMLSVFERTREIGLLRAVGMTRRQTRRMIRWEAVIVAVFGGLMGIVLGLVLGAVSVAAMPESFVSEFGVPIGQFVVILLLCVVMGIVAAILPARRAARMDVLQAIYHA
ncbi:ABC transporter permease [Candidatus Poriferisodalis sp.]|uniref:ABC transporter permease n=1 Tax=Candidatus Poriferisodalis sp. TaxID=3101277 RepID=UPI003C6EA683